MMGKNLKIKTFSVPSQTSEKRVKRQTEKIVLHKKRFEDLIPNKNVENKIPSCKSRFSQES